MAFIEQRRAQLAGFLTEFTQVAAGLAGLDKTSNSGILQPRNYCRVPKITRL